MWYFWFTSCFDVGFCFIWSALKYYINEDMCVLWSNLNYPVTCNCYMSMIVFFVLQLIKLNERLNNVKQIK